MSGHVLVSSWPDALMLTTHAGPQDRGTGSGTALRLLAGAAEQRGRTLEWDVWHNGLNGGSPGEGNEGWWAVTGRA